MLRSGAVGTKPPLMCLSIGTLSLIENIYFVKKHDSSENKMNFCSWSIPYYLFKIKMLSEICFLPLRCANISNSI